MRYWRSKLKIKTLIRQMDYIGILHLPCLTIPIKCLVRFREFISQIKILNIRLEFCIFFHFFIYLQPASIIGIKTRQNGRVEDARLGVASWEKWQDFNDSGGYVANRSVNTFARGICGFYGISFNCSELKSEKI